MAIFRDRWSGVFSGIAHGCDDKQTPQECAVGAGAVSACPRWRARTEGMVSTRLGDAELLALHHAWLRGDGAAREQLAIVLLDTGRRSLRRKAVGVDVCIVDDAVEDAIVHYLAEPRRYKETLARLDTFISVDARHRMLNAIRSEARRRRHHVQLDPSTEPPAPPVGDVEALPQFAARDLIERSASGPERAFLDARAHGERRTAVLARLLELNGLTVPEERLAVKRVSDKLMLRLRRLAKGARE